MKVILDHVEQITDSIYTFWFSAESKPNYIAGQFIELKVPHDNKDKRGDKHWFTLSSSPSEALLSITTRFAAENGSSFKTALRALKPGVELNMSSPMGDFVLPKDATIPVLLVAGGIGCTPFRSMCKYLLDTAEAREVRVVYNVNSAADVAFKDVFEKYGKNFTTVAGERLTAQKILEFVDDKENQHIYLSGPEPMVEGLNKGLKDAGFNKKHISTDFFPGYTEI